MSPHNAINVNWLLMHVLLPPSQCAVTCAAEVVHVVDHGVGTHAEAKVCQPLATATQPLAGLPEFKFGIVGEQGDCQDHLSALPFLPFLPRR